jgi:hypothetical protein
MSWTASVASVGADAAGRSLATVELGAPGRFPGPGWFEDVDPYAAEALATSGGAPNFTAALIGGLPYRLAALPEGNGTRLQLDVSGSAVAPGDAMCLLCDEHTLYDLSEVGGWAG